MVFVTIVSVVYALAFVATLATDNTRAFFSVAGQKRILFAALGGGVVGQAVATLM